MRKRPLLPHEVSKGEYDLCELLLTKGARPTNRKDAAHGNTSLHVAVEQQAEHLVRLLVRHKAELSEQNRRGQTPLILGAQTGQASVVELLLRRTEPQYSYGGRPSAPVQRSSVKPRSPFHSPMSCITATSASVTSGQSPSPSRHARGANS